MNKTNSLKRLTMLGAILAAMMAALPAMAADYVLAYVNGGTTYYLARNGTSGVQRVTTFDPTTCIWSCASNTAGTTAGTLNNSNTYGYLYQTVNGTRYFLNASANALGLGTNAAANNYYRWRTNGTYVYNRYSNNTSYYINLADGVARNTTANTASNARPYQVNTSTVDGTSTAPTISGNDVLSAANSFTYTASGAAYRIGYTNYNFNSANHYFDENGNSFSGTPAAATPSYSWSISSAANVSISGTTATGTVTVSNLPESDMPATITVTVTFTGGTPAAPANTTLTASKEITIQGTKPSAPIISVSGNTATITTDAAGSTSIRYTLDGTEPTASTGTVYSGAIDLSGSTTSPVTIKAVTVRNGNASEVSEQTVTLTLPEPTITINGEAQTATITSSVAGATIYYTTDGSTPTTSSSQYSGTLTGLAYMTTVKAIAVKDGWNNSPVASEIVSISSSVSGGKVTLFDYEDHTWTYYAGIDASVDGGNYNTTYVGKIYSPNPRNVKITYRGKNDVANSNTVVKVSISENDSVFIYYKTLEEGSTSGEYPYKVISNPFSVRPSTGSGNSKVYYGFAGWKIISGGEYIKGKSNGSVLSLDEEIVFENLPYPSVNCTSAEIVFQTTWTTANVQTGNNIATMFGNFSGGTYETNFAVLTGSYTTAWTGNKNATVTSVYPDGSTDSRNGVNTQLNITLNNGYTVKYEYIHINNNNSTLTMGTGTKTLYIGRGVDNTTANGVCCNLIQGYNNSITSGGLSYTLILESGIYNNLSYIKGYDGSTTTNTVTGTVSVKGVLGCDYDRAKGDNSKLKVQSNIIMGYAEGTNYKLLQSATAGQEVLNVTFKSGNLNSNMSSAGTADAGESFYIGIAGGYSPGYRVFTMEGGEMWNLAAGICQNTATTNSIRFRIKGGLVKGSIYGSAANANSYGYKTMVITGGQVKGWVAGGGNGTSANGGTTTGSSYIYIGGNCRIDSEGSDTKINSSLGGNVFGSGSGVENTTTWGEMLYGTNVAIADNAYVERNVFGGGNFGWTDEYANIYLTGKDMTVGNVFGGANRNKGEDINIYMTGGHVREGLYGGSNVSGAISGQINIDIYGTSPQNGNNYAVAAVFGGGNEANYSGAPNVSVHCGENISIGYVYGGGNAATVTGTNVTIEGGNKIGNVFGGCYGANVTTNGTKVNVKGGTIGKVFGGNNQSGSITGGIKVRVDKQSTCPMKIGELYGGGNVAASAVGSIDIGCTGDLTAAHANCNETDNRIGYELEGIGDVYGGANAAAVTGNVTLTIDSGMVYRVFGNNNTSASVSGTITVNIDKQNDACGWYVGHVYGGGNKAPYTAPNATPNYPVVNIKNGNVSYHVFGGGLGTTAAVSGNPQVTLSGTAEVGGNVYGGGNAAPVSGNTKVTLRD